MIVLHQQLFKRGDYKDNIAVATQAFDTNSHYQILEPL